MQEVWLEQIFKENQVEMKAFCCCIIFFSSDLLSTFVAVQNSLL